MTLFSVATYPYIRCRNRMQGHEWDDYGSVPGERPPTRGYVFAHFRCLRCRTVKRYEIHRASGEVLGKPQYFDQPKDYAFPRGAALDPDEIRRQFLEMRGIV